MIVIDHVPKHEQYRDHHTPRIYRFQSNFSIPIVRPDGTYFGTLSKQLEAERIHSVLKNESLTERQTAELREPCKTLTREYSSQR